LFLDFDDCLLIIVQMIFPSYKEFKQKLSLGNLIPVWKEVLADFDTPVSAFKKIKRGQYAFLLESVEGGEKWGRYSFLGTDPSIIFRSKGNQVEIIEGKEVRRFTGDPIVSLRELFSIYKPVYTPEIPRFHGGLVGYFGYDIVRFVEDLPDDTEDDLNLWDSVFMLTDTILVFDNVTHKIKIISNAFVKDTAEAESAYTNSVKKLEAIVDSLEASITYSEKKLCRNGKGSNEGSKLESNLLPERYKDAVKNYV